LFAVAEQHCLVFEHHVTPDGVECNASAGIEGGVDDAGRAVGHVNAFLILAEIAVSDGKRAALDMNCKVESFEVATCDRGVTTSDEQCRQRLVFFL